MQPIVLELRLNGLRKLFVHKATQVLFVHKAAALVVFEWYVSLIYGQLE